MCKYKSNNCSLAERINSIIEKYESNSSACSSIKPGIIPSSTLNYEIYTKRPISACVKNNKMINILPSLSLIDITKRHKSIDNNISSICPGPNLKNYLNTRCPSLKGRLMLYEKHQPIENTNNYQNQSMAYCQCKKNYSTINNKCGLTTKPKFNTNVSMCSWKTLTYEPPFSSTILEREFTSRFVKVPYTSC